MKMNRILVLGAMLLVAGGTYAQEKINKYKATIRFDHTEHDFGQVKEDGGLVTATFTVTNISKTPYVITKVEPSCHCTVSDWTRDTIYEGQTGFVKASFDPKGRPGQFDNGVMVYSNAAGAPIYGLMLKGEVLPREKTVAEKYPTKLGNLRFDYNYLGFGQTYNNVNDTAYITVYNESQKPISLISFGGNPEYLEIQAEQPVVAPGTTGRIIGILKGKKCPEYGLVTFSLKMQTDDEQYAQKDFYGSAHIMEYFKPMSRKDSLKAPHIEVPTAVYNFGTKREGQIIVHEFTFSNTGKKPLIIRKVESSCGCTAGKLEKDVLKPGETTKLTVTFDSSGKVGPQNRGVTIMSNDPANPYIGLYIQGDMVPADYNHPIPGE